MRSKWKFSAVFKKRKAAKCRLQFIFFVRDDECSVKTLHTRKPTVLKMRKFTVTIKAYARFQEWRNNYAKSPWKSRLKPQNFQESRIKFRESSFKGLSTYLWLVLYKLFCSANVMVSMPLCHCWRPGPFSILFMNRIRKQSGWVTGK